MHSHNNNIHETFKLSPNYLFHNFDYIPSNLIETRMVISKKHLEKKLNPLIKVTKVFIFNSFKRTGTNIYIKFKNKGKYIIPGTVEGDGNGIRYPISI